MNPAAWSWIAIPIAATALVLLSRPEREEPPMDDRDHDPITDPTPYVEPDLGAPLDRPHPLRDVAKDVSKVLGTVSGLVTALVGWGILSAAQGDAVTGLLGLLPGLVAAGTTVWAAWRTAGSGEARVTPISDPRKWVEDIDTGRKVLEQLVPAGRHSQGA